MQNKKGQVTIFLVLGMFILLITAIIYLISDETMVEKPSANLINVKSSIKNQVENCLEGGAKNSVLKLGMQGGYYSTPPNYEYYYGAQVAYYFFDGDIQMPELSVLETELAAAISDAITECLDGISELYQEMGIDFSYNTKNIDVKINDNLIILDAYIPTKISLVKISSLTDGEKLNEQTVLAELSSFSTEVAIDYKKMYDFSKKIMEMQDEEPDWFPLSGITDLAFDEDIIFEILSVETVASESEQFESGEIVEYGQIIDDRRKILVSLVDNTLLDEPFYYTFGIIYGFEEEDSIEDDLGGFLGVVE